MKILKQLGLSDKEIKVYFAVLELGRATAQDIAVMVKMPRPTVYLTLKSLIARGSATTYQTETKRYFVAEPPEQLMLLAEQQEQKFKSLKKQLSGFLPELKSIYNVPKDKPTIRFYEGLEGLRAMREHYLRRPNTTLYAIYSRDNYLKVFSEEERQAYLAKRLKKKIGVKAIVTSGGDQPSGKNYLSERRYLPVNKFYFTSDMTILENSIGLASLKGRLSGVIIESQEIASSLRSFFDLAWEAAAKYQKKKR